MNHFSIRTTNRMKDMCLCAVLSLILWHGMCAGPAFGQSARSAADTVKILIPDVWGMPGDTLRVPIFVLNDVPDDMIFSVLFDVTFDTTRIELVGEGVDTVGTLSGWASMSGTNMIDENTFRMVYVSVTAMSGSGCFINLLFRVRPDAAIDEEFSFVWEDCLINEGDPACQSSNGSLTVNEPPHSQLPDLSHDFGTVQVGQGGNWNLRLLNAGSNLLDVYGITSSDARFGTSTVFPVSIASSETLDIPVSFRPNADGFITGNLQLFCNDLDHPIWNISVSGTGYGTSVQLLSFSAQRRANNVLLQWETTRVSDHQGFHVYRSLYSDRGYSRITNELVAGEATCQFVDKTASQGRAYYYELHAIDISGYEETIGRTSVEASLPGPNGCILYQNYPNPFNPTTHMTFSVDTDGPVSLSIFNALGQEVRTLLEGYVTAGQHTQSWDGLDGLGHALPSGMYVYRLQGPTMDVSKRMLLLR